ncbi:MAG TPA: hypothetical protein VMU82_08010 [Acetobacteraceae bacterium]|nr:hypothetical protein [Acetobacteraceae bacterium]
MAETTTPPSGSLTQDAFVQDRQRFWGSFTHFVLGMTIFLVVLLILMGYFLT